MGYTEKHEIVFTTAAGKVIRKDYDDPTEAYGVYSRTLQALPKGAKVAMIRHSSVLVGSAARAA